MKKNILFDLDGTLLPQDQDTFVSLYFKGIMRNFGKMGHDVNLMMQGMQKGVYAMGINDGTRTNEEVFWAAFSKETGVQKEDVEEMFHQYYTTEFQETMGNVVPYDGLAPLLQKLKNKGHRLFLATNPLFPVVSTHERIAWAGLSPDLFEDITTYETSYYSKPNLGYYQEILKRNNIDPEDAVMIGNDMSDDYVVTHLGLDFYLVTDYLINKKGKDLPEQHGTMSDLKNYLRLLLEH